MGFGSVESSKKPVTSSVITFGVLPTGVAKTGVSHAIASNTMVGMPSP
jgi:hypothetical protein